MKIKKSLNSYIQVLGSVRETNIIAADLFIYLFEYGKLQNKNYFDDLINNNGYTSEAAVIEAIEDILELDLNNEENKPITDIYINNSIQEVNPKEYLDNPYRKAINISKISKGKYHLVKESYQPYQLFPLDDITVGKEFYQEVSHVGYFKEDFTYLALLEKDTIWMSVNPNEINTMKPHIAKASGNVLVLGLGLGYYPFMISLKDDVKNITIIEKDQNIIDLFNENILINFPYKEKIKVIKDDAFSYLNKHKGDTFFDYVFCDLWHNPIDGASLYNRLIKYEKEYKGEFLYWIEESLIAMVRRCLITIFMEYLDGYTYLDYKKSKNDVDTLINDLYFKIKDRTFSSTMDISLFLSNESIKELLRK